MITSTQELQYVRGQLVQIKSALATIRQDVLPVDPELFDLMADGYVEQIRNLRAESEEYLGIAADLAGATASQPSADE